MRYSYFLIFFWNINGLHKYGCYETEFFIVAEFCGCIYTIYVLRIVAIFVFKKKRCWEIIFHCQTWNIAEIEEIWGNFSLQWARCSKVRIHGLITPKCFHWLTEAASLMTSLTPFSIECPLLLRRCHWLPKATRSMALTPKFQLTTVVKHHRWIWLVSTATLDLFPLKKPRHHILTQKVGIVIFPGI